MPHHLDESNIALDDFARTVAMESYAGEDVEDAASGRKLYRLVAVSFGLLCVLQAGLNISLRLSFYGSDDTEAILRNMTRERDELKGRLTIFENTEAKLNDTARERDELKKKLIVFADYSQQGWTYFSGSLYYISSQQKSWQNSRSDCLQRGADLVVINSKEEQEFTRRFRKEIWIGLTDREEEGIWKWIDGTPVTMSFWGSGEPNSYKGNDEDCGEIKFYDNENSWNDKPCDRQNVWICEKTMVI